jgi:hypothetical protein
MIIKSSQSVDKYQHFLAIYACVVLCVLVLVFSTERIRATCGMLLPIVWMVAVGGTLLLCFVGGYCIQQGACPGPAVPLYFVSVVVKPIAGLPFLECVAKRFADAGMSPLPEALKELYKLQGIIDAHVYSDRIISELMKLSKMIELAKSAKAVSWLSYATGVAHFCVVLLKPFVEEFAKVTAKISAELVYAKFTGHAPAAQEAVANAPGFHVHYHGNGAFPAVQPGQAVVNPAVVSSASIGVQTEGHSLGGYTLRRPSRLIHDESKSMPMDEHLVGFP